ncbi:MAG: putative enoyl-CoA hydratase echA8 [Pelotomaculum sp. PtaB.Bin104]|nr:MAG: putative enoyl-CoA hydratase echA8 [Pelotomaculum sp. PtaB.Bin104]
MISEDSKPVGLKIIDSIAIITIDNPPVNALSLETLNGIDQALDQVRAETEFRSLIITGAGETFVAGLDIKILIDLDEVTGQNFSRHGQEIMQKIADLPFPTIAAINGTALGGGSELALACNMRLADINARLGFPEINLGVLPGFGGTQRFSRMVPLGIVYEMIYTGKIITAEEAYRIGMVNRVVPSEQVLEEAMKLAELIVSKRHVGIRAIKQAINRGLQLSVRDGMVVEAELLGKLCEGNEVKEGVKAFFEKRPPVFND